MLVAYDRKILTTSIMHSKGISAYFRKITYYIYLRFYVGRIK